MAALRTPGATYRLQFNGRFRFVDARALIPYLHALGITDLYVSPFLKARRGSLHGYDVIDHTAINPDIGNELDLADLTLELSQFGMGLILDVVPNHMGINDSENRWWWDVLENGPSSPYAKFFDIDWQPPKADLANKVLLPILGDQYGKILENQEIQLVYEAGSFFITYYERSLPVAPRTSTLILDPVCERLRTILEATDPHLAELESIITSLNHLPPHSETDPDRVRERQREKDVARRRLATLTDTSAAVREVIAAIVLEMNGQRGDPRSFDRLEALLSYQAYRLCYWRVAADEINYRRFFEINDLAAIRVEEPEVFEAVHTIIFQLLSQGLVTGLRIDHPDGLFDPGQYFLDLQTGCSAAVAQAGITLDPRDRPWYLIVEKILVRDERLRRDWAVHGTTGYEFLNLVNGLFINPNGGRPFHDLYERLIGRPFNFGDVAYEAKKLILDGSMSSELHVLARGLDRISEQHRWSRDFTLFSLQEVLSEVIACFPVYRTYLQAASDGVGDEDRRYILHAVRTAKRRNPTVDESVFDFIASVLLLQDPEGLSEADRHERRNFVMRFQQLTGPVMAKGIEDTAFYRTYPLASLNEVGGNPERFGRSVENFHRENAERLIYWPHTLLTTSTHDTKRSEDVRARINVLSEMPRVWERTLQRWQAWNRDKKIEVDGTEAPDQNTEYLLYQTLIGAWPIEALNGQTPEPFVERIERYMEKALKEAKLHTSWINPNEAYDQAVRQFVRAILTPHADNRFLADFQRFQAGAALAGMWNSLAQTLLKITSPGVPDFYQGTELWDFSLVDPDNRRPVDFHTRQAYLEELRQREVAGLPALVRELLAQRHDGRLKLYIIYRALNFRRSQPELFRGGDYLPLTVSGSRTDHVVTFARRYGTAWAAVAVPRLPLTLSTSPKPPVGMRFWRDNLLQLPPEAPQHWHQILTGESLICSGDEACHRGLSLHEVFRHLPVALLTGSTTAP
jgi:(1->4)-alpha-D-glucan 1-alpha-D-glucosylmutase